MFVFQGRIPIERRGSHYVTLPFEQYFWISTNRGPANLVEENEKIGMYDFPVHDLHSGTKRNSILFFHRSTMQMATSTILTWRHTSPLYKPFTCICVLKPFKPQYPHTNSPDWYINKAFSVRWTFYQFFFLEYVSKTDDVTISHVLNERGTGYDLWPQRLWRSFGGTVKRWRIATR